MGTPKHETLLSQTARLAVRLVLGQNACAAPSVLVLLGLEATGQGSRINVDPLLINPSLVIGGCSPPKVNNPHLATRDNPHINKQGLINRGCSLIYCTLSPISMEPDVRGIPEDQFPLEGNPCQVSCKVVGEYPPMRIKSEETLRGLGTLSWFFPQKGQNKRNKNTHTHTLILDVGSP